MRSNLFGSKRKGDIAGVDDDTAIFLFDEDRRKLMGPWVSIKEGELEPAAFRGSLPYQVGHTSSEALHSHLGPGGPARMLVAPGIEATWPAPLSTTSRHQRGQPAATTEVCACDSSQCFRAAAPATLLSAVLGTTVACRLSKMFSSPDALCTGHFFTCV